MYLLLALLPLPHLRPGPQQDPPPQPGHPQRLKTLRYHYPQTHRKRRLPLLCLPQMLQYPGMPTNQWWNTKAVTQLFQVHRIVCNLPDLSCSYIFFSFKSFSRQSRNDKHQHHWSRFAVCFLHFLIFGKGQTEEDIISHWKKLDRQQADCLVLAFKTKPSRFGSKIYITICLCVPARVFGTILNVQSYYANFKERL